MLSEFIGFACKKQRLLLSYETVPLKVLVGTFTTSAGANLNGVLGKSVDFPRIAWISTRPR